MHSNSMFELIARFLLIAAVFLLPGYSWVCGLHGRDRLAWPLRWALGFAWSFAVFGTLAAPFLWFQLSFSRFLSVLYPAWAIFGFAALIAYAWRARAERRHQKLASEPADVIAHLPSGSTPPRTSRKARLLLLGYLGTLLLAGVAWVTDPQERLGILYTAPLLLLAGTYVAWRVCALSGSLLDFTAADDAPAPRLWITLAMVAILGQAASAVIYSRPDWDDCYFLAAVLDYQQAEVLNDQEPTDREGFEVNPVQRTLCWELLGAVVCHLSGASPLVLFHSLWPGIIVLLAYAAYSGVLAEFIPRRWVPIALLGLSGVFVWGISSHNSASNFLLPRPWQAKTILLHVLMPLLVVSLARYVRQPCRRWWLTLSACAVAGLTMSLSAIFLGVMLAACLAPILLLALRRPWRVLVGLGLALAPFLAAGLFFRGNARVQSVSQVVPAGASTWMAAVDSYTAHGSAEVIWILSLPLLAVLLRDRWRWSYLVGFPFALALTFANPLLYHLVAKNLTSYVTYFRMWWLFPIGPGLAVLFALSVRALSRGAHGRMGIAFGSVTALAGLLAAFWLPNLHVWSSRNNFLGALGTPALAANLEKIPADLAPLVPVLAAKADIRQSRILCTEQIASFLTASSRDFRFVQTRPLYTPYQLYSVGRGTEGLERHAMTRVLRGEPLPADLSRVNFAELKSVFGEKAFLQIFEPYFRNQTHESFPELCDRFQVEYVVTGPEDLADALLEQAGFRPERRSGKCALWSRH
jgi:Family of unknown function (DUF6077)